MHQNKSTRFHVFDWWNGLAPWWLRRSVGLCRVRGWTQVRFCFGLPVSLVLSRWTQVRFCFGLPVSLVLSRWTQVQFCFGRSPVSPKHSLVTDPPPPHLPPPPPTPSSPSGSFCWWQCALLHLAFSLSILFFLEGGGRVGGGGVRGEAWGGERFWCVLRRLNKGRELISGSKDVTWTQHQTHHFIWRRPPVYIYIYIYIYIFSRTSITPPLHGTVVITYC